MDLSNLEQLEDIVSRFTSDVSQFNTAKTFGEVDSLERMCLQELRAIEAISSNAAYRDLHVIASNARRRLRGEAVKPQAEPIPAPEVAEEPEVVEEKVVEEKPKKKRGRRAKKK